MELETLTSIAMQQALWQTVDDYIKKYDVEEGILYLQNGDEFTLNPNAEEQVLDRLHLKGTSKDFDEEDRYEDGNHDKVFVQNAVNWKVKYGQKTPSRVIYDPETNQAKAIKSNRYTMMPNYYVLQKALIENTEYSPEDHYDARYSYIDDNHMKVGFTGMRQVEVGAKFNKGDILGVGVRMWNSQTGNSSLGVGQLLVRLACTNGMTSKEAYDIFRMTHANKDLMYRFNYAMRNILSSDKMIKAIERSIGRPAIVENLSDTRLAKITRIPSRHFSGIRKAHEDDPIGVSEEGVNGWGVYNAVTRYNRHIYPRSPNYNNFESNELMALAYPLITL